MSARTAKLAGWALFGLTCVWSAANVTIAVTNPSPQVRVSSEIRGAVAPELIVVSALLFIAYALAGAVILSKRPGNGVGWILAAGGAVVALETLCLVYGYRALAADPGSLPWGRAAAWAEDILVLPGLALISVFLFLLFPEGRLRTRAERWVSLAATFGIGLAVIGALVEPTIQGYDDIATPLGPGTPPVVASTLFALGYVGVVGALLVSIGLLFRRRRRAVGRERDQLRLFVWAAAVAMVLVSPALLLPDSFYAGIQSLVFAAAVTGLMLVPTSVGVAILRHRLLDIDLVIRRTVVVAILGAFITALYVGVVVGVGALVGSSGNAVLSAVAAAVVALAFQPVRRWAQRLANRFVYGKRATPYEVLHRFSERVAGSYGTEDVLPRMATILGEGTGAERAQVWLRIADELRPAASWPDGVLRSDPVLVAETQDPRIPDVSHAVPVRDGNELLGVLSITKPPSDPVTPVEEKLVGDLAVQAALVMRNVRLVEDLRASRGRLVAVQDAERRKIERNIHDGAQQQLVALAVKAKLADRMVDSDAARAHEILGQVQTETQEALESLRDLARGIYPPLLADEGLAAALEAQGRKAPMPVTVRADGTDRYPQEVEATVYFCCLEALQNASKYSEAASVTITLVASDGLLSFEVADDGQGFDPATTPRGAGLENMADRLDALGGVLEITSTPGVGSRLAGRIPVQPPRGRPLPAVNVLTPEGAPTPPSRKRADA